MTRYLSSALEYAARGWSIIPIGKNKKPALKAWREHQVTRATETELRRMFESTGIQGLAVICGAVSGNLVCRDFDVAEEYHEWAEKHPDWAKTLPTVRTGRGFHVYFRSRGHTKIQKLGDGELRGGGYCLLPPSKHPSGSLYEWVVTLSDGEIPEIDPVEVDLLPALTERTESTESTETTEQLPLSSPCSSVFSVNAAPDFDIKHLIKETLPTHKGQRNRCIFEFARALKAIPRLADAPASECLPYVKAWHKAALPFIATKPFEETWSDFIYAWRKVIFARSKEPLAKAMARADKRHPPPVPAHYEDRNTIRLVALCRELQELAGDLSFFLSCRSAGALLGIDHTTASKRLKMLVTDGVLEVVTAGTHCKAVRYRYVGVRTEVKGAGPE